MKRLSRSGRPLLALGLLGVLAACAEQAADPGAAVSSVRFAAAPQPQGIARANADLAEDFLELTFALETGETLDHILRYETPVAVYMYPGVLDAFQDDLEALLVRLRREAGVPITATADPDRANIFVEAVPRRALNRVFPTAACFVVPGERDWRGFIRRPPEEILRWTDQKRLERAAVFLPADTTPQDVRECLHEEISQALGPANDLYRHADSIWNDDNYHSVVTPFNMLMLRTLYQPEIRSGMTRAEVAAVLPGILDRINPAGRDVARAARHPTDPAWDAAIELALMRGTPAALRRDAAEAAVMLAADMRPVDHRLGVARIALGRTLLATDPVAAAEEFAAAYAQFRRLFGDDDVRTAHAAVHVGSMAVRAGDYALARRLAERHIGGAIAGQNAILLAGLYAMKADANGALGDTRAAQAARIDSLRWARYGFGDGDGELARAQALITALLPVAEALPSEGAAD